MRYVVGSFGDFLEIKVFFKYGGGVKGIFIGGKGKEKGIIFYIVYRYYLIID